MIFKPFELTDIVEGRTTKVASGFWPDGNTSWSSSYLESGFWELSTGQTLSTAYGSSPYDVRKTLYYTDVYPNSTHKNIYKDPFFSITYGHVDGGGSFDFETGSIIVSPTKAIYSQYKNLLLGNTDIDGKFTMKSGSTEVNADDIFVLNFSTYKTKDKIDEGVFEVSFTSPNGTKRLTVIDDSYWVGKVQSVYQLITGSLGSTGEPQYNGIGLLYPNDGIAIFNASKLNELLDLDDAFDSSVNNSGTNTALGIKNSSNVTVYEPPSASYYSGSKSNSFGNGLGSQYVLGSSDSRYNAYLNADLGNQNNTQIFFWSLQHSQRPMVVRKSEYVPSRHYFVRVKNRDFNYSNNPTYVYDGKESLSNGTIPVAGTIKIEEFYTNPKTYITTIGLYNDTNELVAVAKLSRPAVKSFENELLVRIRLDF